jgi:N-acetylneuraminic acid mutarotase
VKTAALFAVSDLYLKQGKYAQAMEVLARLAGATQPGRPDKPPKPTKPPGLGKIEWTRIADLPGDQHSACAAVIDGKIYLVGGQNPSGPPNYNRMRVYDPVANRLSDGPPMSARRYCPSAGVIIAPEGRKELYVVGGYSGYRGLSVVERYIPSTGKWEKVASISGPRGHGVMTAAVNNTLYAIGGFVNNGVCYATNEAYDRKNNRWIAKAPISKDGKPFPMQAGAVGVWRHKIFIFGGHDRSSRLSSTLIYDTRADKWSSGTDLPRSRIFTRAVTFGDCIYLIGGAGGSKVIDVYDPIQDSWSTAGEHPGRNVDAPIITQSCNVLYLLGDSYAQPSKLECWMGEVALPSANKPLVGTSCHARARME